MLDGKHILLVISGGIAAYKSLELIRLLRKNNAEVKCILTKGGAQFVTPLSVSALSQHKVYTDLWCLNDEAEMGHIRLSRECDLIVVAPASADLLAKMTHGNADDLASTCLLASDKPILVAPAMNPQMWANPATVHNIDILKSRGINFIGPEAGDMACGETGLGRMSEAETILGAVNDFFFDKPLRGKKVLITSGPTYEALDPVRFLGNRSSGKQGHAIACALCDLGADVTLISGPTALADPPGINTIHIQSGDEMLRACMAALPVDIAICAAAVSDWKPVHAHTSKIKKQAHTGAPNFELTQNQDILKTLSNHPDLRPNLVVGFAAETDDLQQNALNKLKSKGCDWIIANEVGADEFGKEKAFGQDTNQIYFASAELCEQWPKLSKQEIAKKIAANISKRFKHG